jgi:hypothetical protein
MDSNLFETIKNGKFVKNFKQKSSRLNTKSHVLHFGGHFVNLTRFWPKNNRKVQNGLDQKGDVLEENVI